MEALNGALNKNGSNEGFKLGFDWELYLMEPLNKAEQGKYPSHF